MKFYLKNCGMGQVSYDVLLNTASRILTERGHELCCREADADFVVALKVDGVYQNDRFTVCPGEGSVALTAANDCALHAAFGRWLLECTFDGVGGFVPASKCIDFTPKNELRGMYFATHFYNFYHVAPLEQVYEVIEDLALRGCNNLFVWFDMHHFNSMEDEGAQALVKRLRAMIGYANKIGMYGSLTMLGNEAFANSPEELRAEWEAIGNYHAKPDDHYHLEICPSKPGGIELILKYRREMLSYFCDLDIAYINYWPYDQGGCTCLDCQPWGSNGFIKLLPHFKALVKEMLPKTKIIVSAWYFDKFIKGEWDAFYAQLKDGSIEDVPYVMSFFFNGEMPECVEKGGVPSGYKFIDFPEISMYSCSPWGGFGASVLPKFLNRTNHKTAHLYSGGYPYSEGIFEDINKFIELSWYTGHYTDAEDAVRAYVKYTFCVDGVALDELTDAIIKTEAAIARTKDRSGEFVRFEIADTAYVEYVYRVMTKYNAILPENIRKNYRFRLFYLRAVIDRELVSCDGYPIRSEICQRAMQEVNEIYHATEETKRWVKAPVGV